MHEDGDPQAGAGGVSREYGGWCDLVTPERLSGRRVAVAIGGLTLAGLPGEQTAMLDTGAEWSVLPYEVARELGISEAAGQPFTYDTRDGVLKGILVPHSARIGARQGDGIDIDAIWFVSDDWLRPPPVIVGWHGFLDRIAFGCDPGGTANDDPKFFFAAL